MGRVFRKKEMNHEKKFEKNEKKLGNMDCRVAFAPRNDEFPQIAATVRGFPQIAATVRGFPQIAATVRGFPQCPALLTQQTKQNVINKKIAIF